MKSKKATVSTGTFVRKHIKALLVGGGLLIVAGILFVQFIFPWIQLLYYATKLGYETQVNNPAKKLASSMLPFAKEHHLKKIYEYNGAADGFDNTVPFFIYIFQGDQSPDLSHKMIKSYLETYGYTFKEYFATHDDDSLCTVYMYQGNDCQSFQGYAKNDGQPYWVMKGANRDKDQVIIEITNHTYFNGANDVDSKFKENSVPSGKTVINITFISHECLGGCLDTESTE